MYQAKWLVIGLREWARNPAFKTLESPRFREVKKLFLISMVMQTTHIYTLFVKATGSIILIVDMENNNPITSRRININQFEVQKSRMENPLKETSGRHKPILPVTKSYMIHHPNCGNGKKNLMISRCQF